MPREGQEKEKILLRGGILSFVKYLNKNRTHTQEDLWFEVERDKALIIAFQYNDGYTENIYTYANITPPRVCTSVVL